MSVAALLDTCVLIHEAMGRSLRPLAVDAINKAALANLLFVSPMSAWEVGMLMAKGRQNSPLGPHQFVQRFLGEMNGTYCGLTADILIDSSFLPGEFHGDPADRILVATARTNDFVLITSDRAILAYGQEGHVKVLEC